MGWSEWKDFTNYGKCIFISSGWKTSSGTNESLITEINTLLIDNEYLSSSSQNQITVNKPFKAMVYFITRTASDNAVNTYAILKNNGNAILSTNDGKKATGKSVISKVYFEKGDIIDGIMSANGTATVHSVLIFV